MERNNFYEVFNPRSVSEYVIVGFDTEYKSPSDPLTKTQIDEGLGKYQVLSYQYHCILFDPKQPEAREWKGICYPVDGERLKLPDFLTFALADGISSGAVHQIPLRIYLAGHFTKADVPAFADFKSLADIVSSIRNTFISTKPAIPVTIEFPDDGPDVSLNVVLRDTMLLTPTNAKSLKAIGELVGVDKIELGDSPAEDLHLKKNMDVLLATNPAEFERYAINDATICAKYVKRIIDQYDNLLGKHKLPPTLTSMGVDLLMDNWKSLPGFNQLEVLGKQAVTQKYFKKGSGHYKFKKVVIDIEQVHWHYTFASECYHGGRNEQFWFGPGFEDEWTDHDLSGAYPTAMALIGFPDWRNIRTSTRVSDFTAETLGMASVEFEFPKRVRFPTLPVRTENGLVFPRKGTSNCGAPEIALAKSLGAKLVIKFGVIVPTDLTKPIFADFIRHCVTERNTFKPKTLENLFWKEISNSVYGKTAQGLKFKLLYDSRDRDMKELPPSKITNPYYATFITSFVRSALGEIINRLPKEVCVFSCTTDGFLSNATEEQMASAEAGPLASIYKRSRKAPTGKSELLEIKHYVRKPLGWRTRGQATLIEGTLGKSEDINIVLAKGGIYTDFPTDAVRPRNDYIVDLFLNRWPEQKIDVKSLTGIRDIIELNADLVDKTVPKFLSMEYDWKRRPVAAWDDPLHNHVAFATEAWDTIDQFIEMRRHWDAFGVKSRRCIKTLDDFDALAKYVLSISALGEHGRYMGTKSNHDIRRLRQALCAAWQFSHAGLIRKKHGKTAAAFATILTDVGIPCAPKDLGNARKGFSPKTCPPTDTVLDALDRLQSVFPTLDKMQFVADQSSMNLTAASTKRCAFRAQSSITRDASASLSIAA